MTGSGWARLAALVAGAVLTLGAVVPPPGGHGPPPNTSVHMPAGPPVAGALPRSALEPLQSPVPAVRAGPVCVSDPGWCNPPTALQLAQADAAGRYRCRNTANVTPCCPQWWQVAMDVGWPTEALAVLDYVMARESTCHPGATGVQVCNRTGCARALGLTQLLGWSCPPAGCYDPASNLAKALELYNRSGWASWHLAGDGVTG